MPKSAYFVGKIGTVVVTFVAQVIILVAVGVLFYGISLPSTALQWFTFAWASVLGLVSCTLLGIAFSVVPKTARGAAAVVTPIVIVLQFTSGVFFVFSQLPQWMQVFASLFPLKWLAQAMRSVFLPEYAAAGEVSGSWQLGYCALALGVWTILGAVLAITFFRWQKRGAA
jgi:ABC-2 type transport system permease protein